MRPKANKPSVTNKSGMNGGLFGREPGNYGEVIAQEPTQNRLGGGGGLDFLARVEAAEVRAPPNSRFVPNALPDSRFVPYTRPARPIAPGATRRQAVVRGVRLPPRPPPPRLTRCVPFARGFGPQERDSHRQREMAYADQAYLNQGSKARRHAQERGGIVFGDDSSPPRQQASHGAASSTMYQTTNGANQQQMQDMHQQALQRHHEGTLVKLMVEEHGMSEKEAWAEIALYRKEVGEGLAAPLPNTEPAPRGRPHRQTRGEGGNLLSATPFEDPFKARSSAATPGSQFGAIKPWEVDDPLRRRSGNAARPASQHGAKSKPWDVGDPFKQRSPPPPQQQQQQYQQQQQQWASPSPPQYGGGMSGGGNRSHSPGDRAAGGAARNDMRFTPGANGHVNANRSSVPGGIFGDDTWS